MPIGRHPVAVPSGPLAQIPLDRGVIQRLEQSYGLVRERDQELALYFYARLFEAAPHLRGMFRSEPAEQAAKLTASLRAIIENLSDPRANARMLHDLGRRHAEYGAKPEHYALVSSLLVDAIAYVLGDRSSADMLEEWRVALRLISEQMIAAGFPEASRAGRPPLP